ncbi:MAG: hypothetical protein ACRD1Y_08190 [Terriglobales bacterium]
MDGNDVEAVRDLVACMAGQCLRFAAGGSILSNLATESAADSIIAAF